MSHQFFGFVDVWFKLMTFLLCGYLVFQLRGGKIMYPILLIGLVSFFGFLVTLFGNPDSMWIKSSLESFVFLIVTAWFAYILKP